RLLTIFSGMALLIAAIGIYAVLAYSVTQRTREIGLRLALGAERGRVLRLVVGEGMRLGLIGIALGLLAALAVGRIMSNLVYGVQHTPTPNQYEAIREENTSFEQVAAAGWAEYFLDSNGSISQNLAGRVITANWLPALGVEPLLGRNFRQEEQIAGRDAVVM